jgi:serine/threonine protein kinase
MEGELKGGRYRIEHPPIGEGGMGVVYRARDTRLDCMVALKEIKPEHLRDSQFRRRFALEAKLAAGISHPNIARAIDFVDSEAESFIVYEFVEGVTLRKRLTEHRFTTEEILDIGIKIADTLSAAHEKGFIHRDLKPENIMLMLRPDGPGRVKILDFGLAKRVKLISLGEQSTTADTDAGAITSAGMALIGTINYMSPEQIKMQPVDTRTDIYALGLILYEMATGVNPFRGDQPTSTIANILNLQPPPVAQYNSVSPPQLDSVVRKCMRKAREDRYQSASELRTELKKLQDALRGIPERKDDDRPIPAPEAPIPRRLACSLFLLIQVGYLIMYGIAFAYLPENVHRLPRFLRPEEWAWFVPVALTVLCAAAAVRLYFLAAVAFDYADMGRLFRRVFPGILILDVGFALFALLLFLRWGFITLLCLVALVFLPFSQRTLVYCAYGPRGGRSSAAKASLT